jgi:hypothetical protein
VLATWKDVEQSEFAITALGIGKLALLVNAGYPDTQ